MSGSIDYRSVEIPTDERPSEYSYTERRAEILQFIEKAGHPGSVNQTQLGKRYGVSQQQISKDVDAIREYLVDSIDEQRVDAIVTTVFQTSLKELMAEDRYSEAAAVCSQWTSWLFDRGQLEKEPDKVEAEVEQKATTDDFRRYLDKVDAAEDDVDAGGEADGEPADD